MEWRTEGFNLLLCSCVGRDEEMTKQQVGSAHKVDSVLAKTSTRLDRRCETTGSLKNFPFSFMASFDIVIFSVSMT